MKLAFCLADMVSGGLGWIDPRLCDPQSFKNSGLASIRCHSDWKWPTREIHAMQVGCKSGLSKNKSPAPKLKNPQ